MPNKKKKNKRKARMENDNIEALATLHVFCKN